MANDFQLSGAAPAKQSRFAGLWNATFSVGLCTQRNPLRPGNETALTNRIYGNKGDSLLAGSNVEISNRLTMVRRPGSTVYNSQIFPPIDSFYEFRLFDADDEVIKVLADTESVIYNATGPSTKDAIFTKSPGAGQAYFLSVGNNLYIGDGVDQIKWVESAQVWEANTQFTTGSYLVDSNGNIEVAYGGITVKITQVQVSGNLVSITLDETDPNLPDNLMFLIGAQVTVQGAVNATFLNGQTLTISAVPQGDPAFESNVIQASFVHADYGPTEDSGTVTTGTGTTGTTQPVWNTTNGGWTQDGGVQWLNHGSAVENWGIVAPTTAPTVTQAPLANTYPAWAKNTYYSTSYLIQDENNNIEKATTFGTTGSTEPTWALGTGATTSDGTVIWTNQGSGVYAASSAVAANQYIVQSDSTGTKYFYQALNAGNTGAYAPTFNGALNSQTNDNGIIWVNIGVWADWQSITSSTINGGFAVIPVQGGGTVILGGGQDQSNGTNIALPTGYSNSNLIAWSTAGVGFSGSSVVTEGVFQSTSSGGVLNSSFQGNFGGSAFGATSNWAAACWSSDATVTVTTSGGFTFVNFLTALGDKICLCAGSLTNGATIPAPPSGFAFTEFQYISGMSGSDNPGHIMQVVQECNVSVSGSFSGIYNDGDGNSWNGPGNVFGVLWQTGGGVTTEPVTGGTALLIPTIPGENLAIIQALVPKGSSFGLPSGFGSSSVVATCAPNGGASAGSNHGHGYSCLLSGQEFVGFYADGNFVHEWDMTGNVLAFVVALSNTAVAPNMEIVDSNGKIEKIVVSGLSGQVAPQWAITTGATTLDNTATWQNTGQGVAAGTGSWQWAYAYKNSVTNTVSTASPLSGLLTIQENHYAFLQGQGSTDPQVDTIVIFRTVQGGSVLLYEDEIPNPKNGGTWQYIDTNPDSELNPLITAPIDHSNDPPPKGIGVMTYHLGRIWGAVNNTVYFSGGPDTTIGNGNEAFPPANVFVFPSKVTYLYASTLGLFVFTLSDVFIIQGTSTLQFFSAPFCTGLGLQNYNGLTVNGNTVYMFTSDYQVVSLDLSSGVEEVGVNIGDQFLKSNWDANTVRLTWHIAGSPDKGLYVSDYSNGWFRLYPTPNPETGRTWAPFAEIVGGVSAVESVETSPGVHNLLIGPKTSGPILKRDDSVFTDNGLSYDANFTLGSIVVAQPGQLAELVFLTTDSIAIGARPSIYVQLDEISPFADGRFDLLSNPVPDPPQLAPSQSMISERLYFSTTQQPALGRSLQLYFDWGTQTVQNELLSLTIFGGYSSELS